MMRRRLDLDKEGVSEVVGSILTLAITITIFGTVFAGVMNIEPPVPQRYSEFDVSWEERPGTYYLNITHEGGESIRDDQIYITLFFDDHRENREIENDVWNIGVTERFVFEFEEGDELDAAETIELVMIDRTRGQTIHREMLREDARFAPIIRAMGVEYELPWETHAIPGNEVDFWVEVKDHDSSLYDLNVTLDLDELGRDIEVMEPVGEVSHNLYRFVLEDQLIPEDQENGTYWLEVDVEDEIGRTDSAFIVLHVGEPEIDPEDPKLHVDEERIEFDPEYPRSGEMLYVSVGIYNTGGSSTDAHVVFNVTLPYGDHSIEAEVDGLMVPAGGGRDVDVSWSISPAGTHNITVEAYYNDEVATGSREIDVQPNLLVVDGDPAPDRDTASPEAHTMKNSLSAVGFDYDWYKVPPGGSGPPYEDPDVQLSDYDIVIWMTGSETHNTLTPQDRTELSTFLENNHRLWLIGDGIAQDTSNQAWLEDEMHADFDSEGSAPEGTLAGVHEDIFEEGDQFEVTDNNEGDYITPVNQGSSALLDTGVEGDNTVAVAFNSTEGGGTRTFFQSIRFDSVLESGTGHRTELANKVIMWLGDISHKRITDLAVTSQEFSNQRPTFRETVTISSIIRNNGMEGLTADVALMMNDEVYEIGPHYIEGASSIEVEFEWPAEPVGSHELLVVVDPFNRIEETTEENNDIRYQGVDVTVHVRFNTLIVDGAEEGDSSADNIVEVYELLDYSYELYEFEDEFDEGPSSENMSIYNMVIWTTGTREEDTLSVGNMQNITDYVYNYTGTQNFLLIGDGILGDLTEEYEHPGVASFFLENVLYIDEDTIGAELAPKALEGVMDDPVSHGMNYRLHEHMWDVQHPFTYDTRDRGVNILRDNGRNYAHRVPHPDFNLVFSSVSMSHFRTPIDEEYQEWYDEYEFDTSEKAMRVEFLYMVNDWFGHSDGRIELRVSDVDFEFERGDPNIGRSYLVTTRIQNVGDVEANALVRFRDGKHHIASESAYIPANGFADVEIQWVPEHAAPERPIRVIVDPIDEVPEVPNMPGERETDDAMGFNNQAITETPVYYFSDDMEAGAGKWSREAQLAYISGESPIDYMGDDYKDLDTEVAGNWSSSEGVELVDDHAFSNPNSYFMEEPEGPIGVKADVFVVITIDNSFSMYHRDWTDEDGNTMDWLEAAKMGSHALVEGLSNESVVGLWAYEGTNPTEELEPTPLEGDGRDTVLGAIDDISQNPQAPLWDTVGYAYETIKNNIGDYPDLTPAVVALGEGLDTHAADEGIPTHMIEAGSDRWGPWREMWPDGVGDGLPPFQYLDNVWGKYQIKYHDYTPSDYGWWNEANLNENRRGLLYSDIPIFTIGLGLEHFGDPYNVENPIEDPDWDITYDEPPQGDDGQSYPYQVYDCQEFDYPIYGTTEYQLWHIANTSDAAYFFAPDPGDLEDIFDQIAQMLTGPQNLTGIEDPIPMDTSGNNGLTSEEEVEFIDRWAVTPQLDLTNTSSAWLSFWHRYRLIQGVNGAYIEIGYENDDGEMMWRHIKPSIGPYTGNLLEDHHPTDSFNNTIQWCWNGKSAGGTMNWERVKIDLLRDDYQIPEDALDTVRVRFYYKQYGGGLNPGGWWIDDVSVVATRSGDWWDEDMDSDFHDMWQLTETVGMDGELTTAWWNADPETSLFKGGVDSRLITDPIDLRNARTANLTAEFKFNINTQAGRPPDGFRVEVSEDGGAKWSSINLGARAASGVSGDGDSNYWVQAEDLTRLNLDLSDFSGNVIQIRFRVVTNNHGSYDNFQWDVEDFPEDDEFFGGLYINNVYVYGETARQ